MNVVKRILGFYLMAALAACSRSQQEAASAADTSPAAIAGDTAAQGIIRSIGADPFAQLVIQPRPGHGEGQVAIAGELSGELAQLQGAEVLVRGSVSPNQPPNPPRAIEVTSYEIVSVGGERPYVGTLEERDGVLMLADLVVVGAPHDLRDAAGGKVWIAGPVSGGSLRVSLYGIIKRP